MNHSNIQEKIWNLDDPQMSGADRLEIKKHLETCPDCRDSYLSLTSIQESLILPPAESDGTFVFKVMERLRDLRPSTSKNLPFRVRIPKWIFPLLGYGFAGLLMFIAIESRQPWSSVTTQSVLLADVPSEAHWQYSREAPDLQNLLPATGGS